MADSATLLRDHVTLQYRAIDRIFLQADVPKLQSVGQVCTFLRWQRNFKIPSSAAFGQIGDAYVKAIHRFAEEHHIPVVKFKKGQDKEAIARPYLEAAAREGKDRVVLIGIGQEKASVWRSKPQKGQEHRAHPHMEWWREMAFINHFYFYIWDSEWGGTFWKTNGYAPFPIWLWLNGHEWAKRQLEHAGIRYKALDNGFRSCEKPDVLQKTCQRLGPEAVKSFFWRWVYRLPSPFSTADFHAGTCTGWPSGSLKCRRPVSLTARRRGGCGSKASFAIISTSAARIRSRSSSAERSLVGPPGCFGRAC